MRHAQTFDTPHVAAALLGATFCLGATLCLGATATAQGGGHQTDQSISVNLLMQAPALNLPNAPLPGFLTHDQAGGAYLTGQDKVDIHVGSRRAIVMVLGRRTPRRIGLSLGDELTPIAGDAGNPVAVPPLDFFAANGVPRPDAGADGILGTPDDGIYEDVQFVIGVLANVSALGHAAVTDGFVPDYCDALGNPIPPTQVDPNDPSTFSHMLTNARLTFSVDGHKWTLMFGVFDNPNRDLMTHPDAAPVKISRVSPASPEDPNTPWQIETQRWNTGNPARDGRIVAYLFYNGVRNDPVRYAGAFDVRWADDVSTRWLVHPVQ